MSDIPGSTLPPLGNASKDERTWAMAAHLSALLVLILPTFGNVIGPLIVWLVKRDTMPFVAQEGKEALNFQLTQTIILLGCAAITFLTCGIGAFIGAPLALADVVFLIVMSVIAAIKANEGQAYRYPLTWRMIT
jgi:uncharacterized Tic20 family protein